MHSTCLRRRRTQMTRLECNTQLISVSQYITYIISQGGLQPEFYLKYTFYFGVLLDLLSCNPPLCLFGKGNGDGAISIINTLSVLINVITICSHTIEFHRVGKRAARLRKPCLHAQYVSLTSLDSISKDMLLILPDFHYRAWSHMTVDRSPMTFRI